MKNRLSIFKRSISALLSILMLITMVPVLGTTSEVEAADEENYISMPITIRDYAADGMLFEFNQVEATGTFTSATTTRMNAKVNPSNFNNDNYSWICVFNNRST